MYKNGQGVLQNYKKAHMFFNIAASNGSEAAKENRDSVAKEMTPEAISEAQDMVRKWMAVHE